MQVFENHKSWPAVKEVCDKLLKSGYRAYLAGGCVRDGLLQRPPNDFDIATDASVDQIEGLFEKTILVGKQFGVLQVVINGESFDVATFRKDGSYTDGRHPDSIQVGTPEEDAARRDFTINSMFYCMDKNKIIDFFDGKKDLKNQLIRTVGSPTSRFDEDHLRALRAVRFSAQLGFSIEDATWKACFLQAENLQKISKERLRAELIKISNSSGCVQGVYQLQTLGFWSGILSLQSDQLSTEFFSNLQILTQFSEPGWESFLKSLIVASNYTHGVNDDRLEALNHSLIFTKHEAKVVKNFSNLFPILFLGPMPVGEILQELDKFGGFSYLKVLREFHLVKCIPTGDIDTLLEQYNLIKTEEDKLPQPLVDSDDLLKRGVSPGKEMGTKLKQAYCTQLENINLDKQKILELIS